MALAFFLLPSLGDYGVVPSLAIITAGYGLTGRNPDNPDNPDNPNNLNNLNLNITSLLPYFLTSLLPYFLT